MAKYFIALLGLILSCHQISFSQRLIDIIEQSEKATLTVTAQNSSGDVIAESSGFLISADGIAIIPAHLFSISDSISVSPGNGRNYGISRVLQFHPQADLAMIKIATNRDLPYFVPSKLSVREDQEVLIIGNSADMEDGLSVARIADIRYQPFLNRLAILSIRVTRKSFAAPVVNTKGDLVGIISAFTTDAPTLVMSPYIINDTNWVDLNLAPRLIRFDANLRVKMNSDLNEGICQMANSNFEKAANSFSKYLKLQPNEASVYALRSQARFKYQNTYGSKEDITTARRLNPQCHLAYYYNGLQLLENNNKEEALINFTISTEKKHDFVYALVERGKLRQTLKNDLEAAYDDFDQAVRFDTTFGAAYYEKARFMMQYFDDKRNVIANINKAIELDPSLPGVYTIRGTMMIDNQNYLSAINDFELALEKNPSDTYALFNKGIAEYNLGQKERACNDWEKAGNMGHYKALKYLSNYCSGSSRKY